MTAMDSRIEIYSRSAACLATAAATALHAHGLERAVEVYTSWDSSWPPPGCTPPSWVMARILGTTSDFEIEIDDTGRDTGQKGRLLNIELTVGMPHAAVIDPETETGDCEITGQIPACGSEPPVWDVSKGFDLDWSAHHWHMGRVLGIIDRYLPDAFCQCVAACDPRQKDTSIDMGDVETGTQGRWSFVRCLGVQIKPIG